MRVSVCIFTVCVCFSNCVCVCVSGAFDDEDIIHVEGNVDPVRDIEIIHEELRLKDEELIAPIIDKLEKMAVRGGDKKLKPEYVSRVLCVCVCVCCIVSAHNPHPTKV